MLLLALGALEFSGGALQFPPLPVSPADGAPHEDQDRYGFVDGHDSRFVRKQFTDLSTGEHKAAA